MVTTQKIIFGVHLKIKWYRALIFTWPYGSCIGVPKQWNGGHVDVPNQSCFFFVPTKLICIDANHVRENTP